MHPFSYHRPTSYDEVLGWLSGSDQAVALVAGATDLIPRIRDGVLRPDVVLDIKDLPGVHDLRAVPRGSDCSGPLTSSLYIGAAVTMNELARSELVKSHWDVLASAAATVGNEQVRNRATIGGNICTASPAADLAPALYVLEATVRIRGPEGDRDLPIARFFAGPRKNALGSGDFVVGLMIPRPPDGAIGHFEKLSRRKAGDLSIVSVAALAAPGDHGPRWRLALGAVGPTPLRAPEAEAILAESLGDDAIDHAAAAACGSCSPIADIRSGLAYRQAMITNLSRRAIRTVIARMPAA